MCAHFQSIEQKVRELGTLEPKSTLNKAWRSHENRTLIVRRLFVDENKVVRATSGTLIALYLSITSCVPGKLYLMGYELELPWWHPEIDWLADATGLGTEVERFLRDESLTHPEYPILGQRPKLLRNGDLLEGVLLGHCHGNMPDEIQSDLPLKTTLHIFTQRGEKVSGEISLRVRLTGEVALRNMRRRAAKAKDLENDTSVAQTPRAGSTRKSLLANR